MSRFVDRELEMAVIGGALDDVASVLPVFVTHRVAPEWFSDELAWGAFEVVRDFFAQGRDVDLVTVRVEMERRRGDDKAGLFLAECLDACASPELAGAYVERLRDFWLRREICRLGRQVAKDAEDVVSPLDLLGRIPELFGGLVEPDQGEKSNADLIAHSIELWGSARERRQAGDEVVLAGLETGIPGLDEILCGLQPGLLIIGGRPSEGKTTLGDQIMQHVAVKHGAVALATLDMTRERMLRRVICREAGVSLPKLAKGFASVRQLELCKDVGAAIGRRPVFITDRLRDIKSICSWGRMMKMRHDVKLLMVDHASLVDGDENTARWNKNAVVSQVSGSLKALSIDLGIPVILLSQLNRQNKRDNRPPELEDLRESGSLEQDANVVLFVYKDSKKDLSSKNVRAEWIEVKKQQDGEQAALPVWLHAPYFFFEEAAWGADEDGNDVPFAMKPGEYAEEEEESGGGRVASGNGSGGMDAWLDGLALSAADVAREIEDQ